MRDYAHRPYKAIIPIIRFARSIITLNAFPFYEKE